MKTSELRIGNYVYDRGDEIVEVVSIVDQYFVGRKRLSKEWYYGKTNISNLKPIPISPDHLIRTGFEYDNKTDSYFVLINMGNHDFFFEIVCRNGKYFFDQTLIQIEYLHQLQNIFFSLTNIELILK